MAITARLRAAALAAVTAATAGLALIAPPAQATAPPFSTTTVSVTRNPASPPLLVRIRTGMHANFDRVVFDLRGQPPGYRVGYVKVVRADPSDKVVTMRGNYYLMIRLRPANAHTPGGTSTYPIPHKFWIGYPQLRQIAFVGDFEAVVSVALGLRHRTGFRVFTLRDPTRIVVDVHH